MIDERILANPQAYVGKMVEVSDFDDGCFLPRTFVGCIGCEAYAISVISGNALPYRTCRPIEPQWIIPTDADALSRPKCRVRDYHGSDWQTGYTLSRVLNVESYRFQVQSDKSGSGYNFHFCEILKPPVAVQ